MQTVACWSAVINGVTTTSVVVVMMRMFGSNRVMRGLGHTNPALRGMGWLATLVMALAAAGLFLTGGSDEQAG